MSTSKKPTKAGAPRKRGRPTDRLALTEEQAMGALDRMLGKKPATKDTASAPIVRSKKKREQQ